nr:PilC/PilY family type IV pilus protein [uncultured Pseudomonas sp.]
MTRFPRRIALALLSGLYCLSSAQVALAAADTTTSQVPAQLPLFVNPTVPPLNLLVVGRDHKLFFPAYNDASDLDGDGSLDIRYNPEITYFGYFDSNKCYTTNSGKTLFTPSRFTDNKKCGGQWSGDYLNYLTTSRADALRKVLYGGYRSTDTATETVLERSYIRQDAHTWGKEYLSVANDGYDIADYTPYTANGTYTLFANASTATNSAPYLRVLRNVKNTRIWGWVAREVTQGGTSVTNENQTNIDNLKPDDYVVRVKACVDDLLESNCKLYPNGNYKPTGLLHDYGEGNQMYFGLLTGSYANNLQGGVLRKAISSFSNELDANNGIFGEKSTDRSGRVSYTKQGLIASLDGIRISDPKNDSSYGNCTAGNDLKNGSCKNWGNPLGEMMYEALRYYSGATTPTAGYSYGSDTTDASLGMTQVTEWVNPYSSSFAYSCSKPFMTVLSDVNPNYDSDLPGSQFSKTNAPAAEGALADFSAKTLGDAIWSGEKLGSDASINIGEVAGGDPDDKTAPTAKRASSFGDIRGLPEEPTKQGTYNAAAVAYYGNTNPITKPKAPATTGQSVKTFAVALSSPLPRIQMPVGTNTVTLVPFGKVVTDNPDVTMQITGFFVQSMYNMKGQTSDPTKNGGRPQAIFRVIFDDAGQGADYDVDSSVLYTVSVNSTGGVDVQLTRNYANAGWESHMGYTIAGTTKDGIYLEVTGGRNTPRISGSGNTPNKYKLDTPSGKWAGECTSKGSNCGTLSDKTTTRTFTPSQKTLVTNLQDPLWYAAKWGGFDYSAKTPQPVTGKWDSQKSGTPDNYFLVTNATTLKDQMSKAFNQILQSNGSIARPAVLPVLSSSNSFDTYTTDLNVTYWSGDLVKSTKTTGSNATSTRAWSASEEMPSWSLRTIKMANASADGLQDFTYNNLAGRTYGGVQLQTDLDASKVAFIKGDRSNEGSYRTRTSLIGDIINSGPVLVGGAQYLASMADTLNGETGDYAAFKEDLAERRAQVYIGANDGMLHAFDAADGVEKFAYIPTPVIPNLHLLTDPTYNSDSTKHRYFVDGTPTVADVYFGGAWHTVLIGTLRAGGRGVFALDITDPDNISLLWEFTAQSDADLGSTFAMPVVARLASNDKTGGWTVLLGNGYGGSEGNASLFILDVATGRTLKKLTTSNSTNNGLSGVRVADANSDGIADYAYAGDLQGNVWRFNLAAGASGASVAFSNHPLYSATVSATEDIVQSITAAPSLVRHPSGTGFIVMFGTGRYFTATDKASKTLQTIYGIWDKLETTAPSISRSDLVAQNILESATTTNSGVTQTIRTVSQNSVNYANKMGWTLDLVVDDAEKDGERVTDDMLARGNVLLVPTRIPNEDPCSPGLSGWTYGLDPLTGGATKFNVFDLNRDGIIDARDSYGDDVASGIGNTAGGIALSNDQLATPDDEDPLRKINYGPNATGRQSWRLIPNPTN